MPEIDRTLDGSGRRVFMARATALCAGGMACLACPSAFARQEAVAAKAASAQPAKFGLDSQMPFKRVYDFAYTNSLIPVMKGLADEIGREKLVAMLKTTTSKTFAEMVKKTAPPPPKNTLEALVGPEQQDYFWSHVLTMKRIENKPASVEVRVTECLWASTFRAADAADIGYACVCHPDFATASAFNPKIKMIRTKTLMQGDEYCNHRWVVEA